MDDIDDESQGQQSRSFEQTHPEADSTREKKGGGIARLAARCVGKLDAFSPLCVDILSAERLFAVDGCRRDTGRRIRLQGYALGSRRGCSRLIQLAETGPAKLPLDLVFLATGRATDSVREGFVDHEDFPQGRAGP